MAIYYIKQGKYKGCGDYLNREISENTKAVWIWDIKGKKGLFKVNLPSEDLIEVEDHYALKQYIEGKNNYGRTKH